MRYRSKKQIASIIGCVFFLYDRLHDPVKKNRDRPTEREINSKIINLPQLPRAAYSKNALQLNVRTVGNLEKTLFNLCL